jgi:DnaJ family protein A protein 2
MLMYCSPPPLSIICFFIASMFGGGGMGMNDGKPPRRTREPRAQAPGATIEYTVSLVDLYLGRSAHFQLSRDIFCPLCQGSGARAGCKSHECVDCKGTGSQTKLASMGGGYVRTHYIDCPSCKGEGIRIREKERCRKCKGGMVVKEKAKLNVNIEPGMRDGQKLLFKEQSDCVPGCKKAGNLVIQLKLKPTDNITLVNNDLKVSAQITLSEALLGLERAVFTHLDGRSIRVRTLPGQVIRPGDICVLRGEGIPGWKGDRSGDLYIEWKIDFPQDHWLPQIDTLKLASLLPPKRSDPSKDHVVASGKVGEHVVDAEEEVQQSATKGLGRVQQVTLIKGRIEEVRCPMQGCLYLHC